MKKHIRKVAVLGSGVMGSQLACHFANAGLQVLLLDMLPRDLAEDKKTDPQARNSLAQMHLKKALKTNPSPIFDPALASRITVGNFEDDMKHIAESDWVLEVVVERPDIKKLIFEEVEKYRKPGTFISSNTSGISINLMAEGRSEDFRKYFLGTHFFNPPRYLELLEIIPSESTDPSVTEFFMDYGDRFLGKTTVLCKDTPAFIANRIGVFSIMAIFHLMEELDLTVEEIDSLTGPLIGHPKSATFRTCDLVGLDTLVKVANGVRENCPNDESADLFKIPDFLNKMIEKGWLGDKSGQGFYKKEKDENGKSIIYALDLKTFEYHPKAKPRFASVGSARALDRLEDRLRMMHRAKDKAGDFLRKLSYYLFRYVSHRIPEIANELYKIDDGVKAGFGWKLGAFEQWDLLGVADILHEMEEAGLPAAPWVGEMLETGKETFYRKENGIRYYYDIPSKEYKEIPGSKEVIRLGNLRVEDAIWKNKSCILHDIGEGVLCMEFSTKGNTIGQEVLEGINKSIDIASDGYNGLVIGNDGDNFSLGANLALMLMLAMEQEFDELDMAVRYFQNTVMRIRYSPIPVVIAAHGMTLGGGCEMTMHADAAVCAAETYIGLVEFGVGLLPAGGGTKEMVLRTSDAFYKGDPQIPQLRNRFLPIATARVAKSAYEAFDMGILDRKKDVMVMNKHRLITEARRKVIELSERGYTQPIPRNDIEVLGRTALGAMYSGTEGFYLGHYATEYDKLIANKIAYVMCGGDLTGNQKVSEQYLLDLEREAFLSLLGQRKTLERMQHILKTGKPLRN